MKKHTPLCASIDPEKRQAAGDAKARAMFKAPPLRYEKYQPAIHNPDSSRYVPSGIRPVALTGWNGYSNNP